ncbi:hypothetical protein GF373_11335, partial [bacterium]|nr:hypothetical protein [bacterium]
MQTVIRYCWHIRFFLLGSAFLLVPLTIDPHIQRGSGPETKFRVFEFLVLCILFFSIPSLFEKRRMPWFSFLSSLCLGFAGFLVIRACFDPHWHFALDHAFQLAAWLVFAVLLVHTCRDWPNFRHLMFIGVLVQIPLVVYALGQVHGVDIYFDYILKKPWRWENKLISAERSQILALGNPNFYASYASLLLIWLAAFFMAARERWQRIAWALYMAVVFYTLIFTFTRGVWLSLLFTVCVLALFLILKTACQETDTRLRGKRMLQYAMILVFVLMIVAGVYALGKGETGGPIAFMQERFAHGFTFRDTSLRARPLLWYASIQMWNEAPVFGIGLGQFGAQFIDTLYHIASTLDAARVQAVAKNMQTLFALRSHNDYLQFLAETGAVGYGWFLLLLLTFLAHAGRRVWKRGETDNPFLFACFAIVIFIALQCAFDFPLRLPATSILFSAALGGILITEQKEKVIARLTIPRFLFQTFIALGVLGVVLASSWVVLSHAMASHHFRKAQVRVDRLGTYS